MATLKPNKVIQFNCSLYYSDSLYVESKNGGKSFLVCTNHMDDTGNVGASVILDENNARDLADFLNEQLPPLQKE